MLSGMPRIRPSKSTIIEGHAVHAESGEVIDLAGARFESVQDAQPGRAHKQKERSHPMFALIDTQKVGKLELTIQEQRVFWCVVGHLSKDTGKSRVGTGEIAEETGMLVSNVGTTLTSLKRRRILFRERIGVWIVNPWIAYAGSVVDWEADTTEFAQPKWSRS